MPEVLWGWSLINGGRDDRLFKFPQISDEPLVAIRRYVDESLRALTRSEARLNSEVSSAVIEAGIM